jgi:hypothetical protein
MNVVLVAVISTFINTASAFVQPGACSAGKLPCAFVWQRAAIAFLQNVLLAAHVYMLLCYNNMLFWSRLNFRALILMQTAQADCGAVVTAVYACQQSRQLT